MNEAIVTQRRNATQRIHKKPRDERIPTSVHHIGIYTVKIYNEEGYRKMKEQYCTDEQGTTSPSAKKGAHKPHMQRKTLARYNWTSILN